MSKKVVVIDYGVGNLLNVVRALEHVGASVKVVDTVQSIQSSDRLVLPGVGAFGNGIDELIDSGFSEGIKNYVTSGRPLLGICLGMQLLFTYSNEFGQHAGLNLIPGKVIAIPDNVSAKGNRKIPHIGWNELILPQRNSDWDNTLLVNISTDSSVYFLHSFMAESNNDNARLANCNYDGQTICAAVEVDNIMGCQFHPEKSGSVGLNILQNFMCR